MGDKGTFLYDLQPKISLKPRIINSNRGYASKYIGLHSEKFKMNKEVDRTAS